MCVCVSPSVCSSVCLFGLSVYPSCHCLALSLCTLRSMSFFNYSLVCTFLCFTFNVSLLHFQRFSVCFPLFLLMELLCISLSVCMCVFVCVNVCSYWLKSLVSFLSSSPEPLVKFLLSPLSTLLKHSLLSVKGKSHTNLTFRFWFRPSDMSLLLS